MLEKLKEEVYKANMLLPKYKLITFTWGNVSGIDRESGIMAIKPSGVEYDLLRPEDMVLVDVNTGKKVEGDLVIPANKNFGFVNQEVYVDSNLLKSGLTNGDEVMGTAVIDFNKKKDNWGWRAIALKRK